MIGSSSPPGGTLSGSTALSSDMATGACIALSPTQRDQIEALLQAHAVAGTRYPAAQMSALNA